MRFLGDCWELPGVLCQVRTYRSFKYLVVGFPRMSYIYIIISYILCLCYGCSYRKEYPVIFSLSRYLSLSAPRRTSFKKLQRRTNYNAYTNVYQSFFNYKRSMLKIQIKQTGRITNIKHFNLFRIPISNRNLTVIKRFQNITCNTVKYKKCL